MRTVAAPEGNPLVLRVGDVVEVRSQAEILATLDENGELESLPFMPELLRAAPETLPIRDLGQFVRDVRSGNANVFWAVRAFLVGTYNRMQGKLPPKLRPRGGKHWGYLVGRATKTPTGRTDLRPGDLV